MELVAQNDAGLVAESLKGNHEAFREIVSRYQSLVCSLAYSATGSLSHSEDLAQETFVTAWKQLRQLREPGKLRAWLCGIARNIIKNWLRRQDSEPSHAGETLDAVMESHAPEPLPHDHTISREEEAILWRSLERIPETYREPLVLFYREHQSVGSVAAALELSEDAVKQRLSRGRKLLAEEVTAFVEGALKMSTPGRAFTFGVMAALPLFTTSADAATIGATAANSAAGKAFALAGVSGATLGTLIGILGAWFGVKASLAHATSEKERRLIIRCAWVVIGLVVVSLVVNVVVIKAVIGMAQAAPLKAALCLIGFTLAYFGVLLAVILRFNHLLRRARLETAAKGETTTAARHGQTLQVFEYRSRWTFLGLPLIHVRTGRCLEGKMRPAVGWIAFGDVAVGVLFAAGGLAVGGIGMGGASVGIISLGGLAVGGLAFGGLAFGGAAIGGAAVGILALGGVALAWQSAVGGIAVAKHLAMGGVAQAQHANDAVAKAFFDSHPFVQFGMQSIAHSKWLAWLCVVPVGFSIWFAWQTQRKRQQHQRQEASRSTRLPLIMLLCLSMFFGAGCGRATEAGGKVDSASLPNGLRVVSVHFPASTNVSIFTFLPMGLTADAPDQAQWSHLVEHLVIRSTIPANSAQANAETLPDHMRLDFYGHTGNWKEGLTHHRRWLEGVPFTEVNLAAEKPRVIAECDFTARNLTTHKFTVAAWSHGMRHGRKHVALKGDVTAARLTDVQRFRDERLAVSNEVTVCVVGGLPAQDVFAEVKRQLGDLELKGISTPPGKASHHNLDLTWDLSARHLLLTWPIPDHHSNEHAALMVAARVLNMWLFADAELKRLTGMTLAGCDLVTPDGNYFFVSASLRPETDFEELRERLLAGVDRLTADSSVPVSMISGQLAESLISVPDPLALKAQTPTHVSLAMIEGNLGLQFGMHEHRYGSRRGTLAKQVSDTSPERMREVVRKHLVTAKAAVCAVRSETASSR